MLLNRCYVRLLAACAIGTLLFSGQAVGQFEERSGLRVQGTTPSPRLSDSPVLEVPSLPELRSSFGYLQNYPVPVTEMNYQGVPIAPTHNTGFQPIFNAMNQPSETLIYRDGKFAIAIINPSDPQFGEASGRAHSMIDEAMKIMRSDSPDAEKLADAKKLLAQVFEVKFDHDQKKRREQLSSLEAQVSKLKAQLEKRDAAKNELIQLRMTLLENEFRGLAFPQAWNQVQGAWQSVPPVMMPLNQGDVGLPLPELRGSFVPSTTNSLIDQERGPERESQFPEARVPVDRSSAPPLTPPSAPVLPN